MAVLRILSQSRSALSRGFTAHRATGSIFRVASTTTPRQHFSSSQYVQNEAVQTPATGAADPRAATRSAFPVNHAQSIAVLKLPWKTTPADVEQLFRSAGLNIKRMQFRIDRFTFRCDTSTFVELESAEQAQKAVKVLNGHKFGNATLAVRPISETFYWNTGFKPENHFFHYDANTPSQAIQGLLDGRRYRLYVENPGWTTIKTKGDSANVMRREMIKQHFGPFGIETIGSLKPAWKQDRNNDNTFLTFIEFTSKDGAERAVEALNGQVVEGKKVYLKPQTIVQPLAEQMEKVDKSLVAKLQEHGIEFSQNQPRAKA
ncbi:hypothetical protein OPT61_g1826 [Boeremia exigua]|uniref:Uncharacterized protein n=1 Tax=Boeremia exigua TaxID=749465 RepID=A0ACC2INY9_9PLEO|nr:hypothetical protein OPT61_g1826 [Boeremia exigua]